MPAREEDKKNGNSDMNTTHKPGVLFCAMAIAIASSAVHADTHPALDRVSLWLGGYYAQSDATARIDSDSIEGTDVSFEDDFGLSDGRLVGRARLALLIGDSQGFEFDAYRFHRSASRRLDRQVVYNGNTYDVNAEVAGELSMDLGSAAYRWWIPAGDADVWGIGLGAAYYRLRGVVEGNATVNDETEFARVDESVDAWAPLVELGWRHAFDNDMRVYADASGVIKRSGNVQGHIYNVAVGLEYFPLANFGVGLEYGMQRVHLEVGKRHFDGTLDIDLDGPSLFARARF
jgi:hypothetical protein